MASAKCEYRATSSHATGPSTPSVTRANLALVAPMSPNSAISATVIEPACNGRSKSSECSRQWVDHNPREPSTSRHTSLLLCLAADGGRECDFGRHLQQLL